MSTPGAGPLLNNGGYLLLCAALPGCAVQQHMRGDFTMKYENKNAFEQANMFGTGTPNTAYAKFFSAIPFLIRSPIPMAACLPPT